MSIAQQLPVYFGATDIVYPLERTDLLCCTRRDPLGSPYQIIYVDESDAWLQDDFGAYIEEILSDHYYTCESYLQWNFYYYFLSDGQTINENSEQKERVEFDEAFARKFVLTPTKFTAMLAAVKEIGKKGGQLESGDLYSDWLNYLRDKSMHFVYDERQYPNYKAWVDQYVNGQPFDPPSDELQSRSGGRAARVSGVRNLELTQFRLYPAQRQFTFGKVNLIFGPNATGKTSFFDALELCFTGQAKGADDPRYLLTAQTESDEPLPYPAEQSVYRQRDIAWYKNVYTRGHNLANNFSKFNYYASDAAFFLKRDDDKGESLIEETITDIALGREINRLEERINEFCTRFENRHEEHKKLQQEQQTELNDLETREQGIRQESDDPAMYRRPVTDFLEQHAWHIDLTDNESLLVNVENAIRLVSDCVEQLSNRLPAGTTLTLKGIEEQLGSLRSKSGEVNGYRQLAADAQRQYGQAEQEMKALQALISSAEILAVYFEDPDIEQLTDIDELLEEGSRQREKQEKAVQLLLQLQAFIKGQPQEVAGKKFFDYQAEIAQVKRNTGEELIVASAESERIRRGLEHLTAIIADIKRLGMDFLEANHDADQCPLCQTGYPHDQLAARIAASATLLGDADNYTVQQKEISRLEGIISNCDRISSEIDELETAIPFAYLDSAAELTLIELEAQLGKDTADMSKLHDALTKLRVIKSRFEEKGLSREQFIEGKTALETRLTRPVEDGSTLILALSELQEMQEKLQQSLQQMLVDIDKLNKKTEDVFDRSNPTDEAIQNNLRLWERVKELCDQIRSVVQLADDQDIMKLRAEAQTLKSLYEVYRAAWLDRREQSKVLEVLVTSIGQLKDRKTVNDRMVKNAKTGWDLLKFLLTEKSKRSYLVDFMNRNKTEMVNIFRQIHAPNEFTDIKFDNQKINLLDMKGSWHTINEVSTGQRTAVALSLFLSLNQKLNNGPDIMLLDDPVTYVDDLNTLSFLDYLRELIEQTGRQVFFATANADVAFLFSKKFAYLAEDQFRRFEFTRPY